MLWKDFIRSHLAVLAAVDFLTAEVWTTNGLMTCYVLVFMRIAPRQICIAGLTAAAQPKLERVFGAVESLSERRVSIENDLVWRGLAPARALELRSTF